MGQKFVNSLKYIYLISVAAGGLNKTAGNTVEASIMIIVRKCYVTTVFVC